jgi:hypothetical protein
LRPIRAADPVWSAHDETQIECDFMDEQMTIDGKRT